MSSPSLSKFVRRMKYWCTDANLGYDQGNRWDIRDGGECDCSSLVIFALQEAGFETGSASYTGNMRAALTANGWNVVKANGSPKTGDILLNEANHVGVWVGSGIAQASQDESGGISGGTAGDQTGRETWIAPYYDYPWDMYLRYTRQSVKLSWIYGNRYLTQTEMENNASLVWDYFGGLGWTVNAVAAMLGNMQSESTINPGIWQSLTPGESGGGGYGLVQWTPWTKYSEWAGSGWENNGAKQCQRIKYELDNGLQYIETTNYPISFREFTKSAESPEYLAYAWLQNYERPALYTQPWRQTQAREWYNYLLDEPTPGGNRLPVWLMKKLTRR